MPTLTLVMWGISAVAMVRPFASLVTRYIAGCSIREFGLPVAELEIRMTNDASRNSNQVRHWQLEVRNYLRSGECCTFELLSNFVIRHSNFPSGREFRNCES